MESLVGLVFEGFGSLVFALFEALLPRAPWWVWLTLTLCAIATMLWWWADKV